MAWFQFCLGFIWTPISGALESLSQTIRAQAVISVTSMILLSSRAEDLKREARDLKAAREDMLVQIDRGRLQNMMPTSEANNWLEEEEEVQSDAAEFQDSFDRMEGFYLRFYYQLGRSAEKILTRARRLKTLRADLTVLIEATPDRVVPQPGSSHAIVGEEHILSEIWRLLEDEDEESKIIGIYGMGGVGKTTLLKEINNELSQTKSDRFDCVIFVTISKDIRVDRIQEDVGIRLGYSPTGPQLPEDPDHRAKTLHTALLRRKFLLLLDDLWEKLDLGEVGIPVSPLSKIVFTTRFADVCNKMGAAGRKRQVPCLSKQSSWKLFSQSLGKREDQWTGSTRALAEAVADKCGGLPLALVTVGRAMADATSDGEWEEALTTLRDVRDVEKDVLTLLKFSFDGLKDERHKQCLLYCSLFSEDYDINVDDIIDYWAGEGFLESGSSPLPIDRVRNRGRSAITDLKAACLLEDGVEVGKHVKLHDMIREMALWITSGACEAGKEVFLVNAGQGLESVPTPERWREATRISLTENSISELPEKPHCPDLRTLLLLENRPLRQIHGGFFQFMPILTVLDLTWTNLYLLPPEIGLLAELRLLNLSHTRIVSLPRELGRLTKLRELNVVGADYLKSIPQEAISPLSCLQSLTLHLGSYECKGGWNEGDGDSSVGREVCLKDLDGMKQLDELGVSVRVMSPEDLQALQGSRRLRTAIRFLCLEETGSHSSYNWIDLFGAIKGLRQLRIAEFSQLDQLIFPANKLKKLEELILWDIPLATISWKDGNAFVREPTRGILFTSLTYLELVRCEALEDITWVRQLPCLITLCLHGCTKMVEIIAVEESVMTGVDHERDSFFPKLRLIILHHLQNLKSICRHPLLFPTLEEIDVRACLELKKLPLSHHSAEKIQRISGDLEWWNGLEWDDKGIRTKFTRYYDLSPHRVYHLMSLIETPKLNDKNEISSSIVDEALQC